MSQTQPGVFQRAAWWCLLGIPALVPLSVSKIPFARGDLLTYRGFIIPKLFALGVLVGLGLACWAVAVVRRECSVRTLPGAGWLLGLFSLALVSTAVALHVPTAVFGESTASTGLFFWLLCGAVLFLTVQLVISPRHVEQLAWAALLGGLVVAFFGILQMFGFDPFGTPASFSYVVGRGASTLGNPDFTGTYLILPFSLGVGLALSRTRAAVRSVTWAAVALLGFALFLSLTRGAWVGAAIAGGVMLAAASRQGLLARRTLYVLACGAVGLIGVAAVVNGAAIARRFGDLTGGWSSAGGGRLLIWGDALRVIARHPLLGVGPDSYRLGWYPIANFEHMSPTATTVAVDPHNVLLMLAATMGIPAMVVGVCWASWLLYRGARTALAPEGGRGRIIYASWWAAAVGMSVAFLFALNSIVTMSCLWLAFGVVLAARSEALQVRRRSLLVAASCAGAFAVAALIVSSMYLTSDYSLARAQWGDGLRLARRAVAQAPWNADARLQVARETAAVAVVASQAGDSEAGRVVGAANEETRAFISFNPHEWYAYYLRAKLLTDVKTDDTTGTLEAAVAAADEGLEVYPAGSVLFTQKARALMKLRRHEEAARTLAEVWDAIPLLYEPGVVYAEALLGSGRSAAADQVLRALKERFEDDPTAAAEIERVREMAN